MVFDFDPLGSNRKCNANKLICILKTNTLLINLCTINCVISISNTGSRAAYRDLGGDMIWFAIQVHV